MTLATALLVWLLAAVHLSATAQAKLNLFLNQREVRRLLGRLGFV